jgi:hypothetical protein
MQITGMNISGLCGRNHSAIDIEGSGPKKPLYCCNQEKTSSATIGSDKKVDEWDVPDQNRIIMFMKTNNSHLGKDIGFHR